MVCHRSSFSFSSYIHAHILIVTEYPLCAKTLAICFSLGFYICPCESSFPMLSLWLLDLSSHHFSALGALSPFFSQWASSCHSGLYKNITYPGKFHSGWQNLFWAQRRGMRVQANKRLWSPLFPPFRGSGVSYPSIAITKLSRAWDPDHIKS